jgi:hypothetical protein
VFKDSAGSRQNIPGRVFSGCNEYESILKRFFVTGDDSSTNNYRHERSYITKFALRQITSFFGVDKFLVGLMKKM